MNQRVLPLIIGSFLLPLGCSGGPSPPSPPGPNGDDNPADQNTPMVVQPSELCSDHPDAAIAMFEDADLEAAIRTELSVGVQEDLTCGQISGLTDLSASSSRIESLVGIQNLTSLRFLYLNGSSITDISALSGLTRLGRDISEPWVYPGLDLDNNPSLTDIQPLLNNPGLGWGDFVFLRSTSVSCRDVAALEAKRVRVMSDCP